MTTAYEKFYNCKSLTRRELKELKLIDRIRYMLLRLPENRWGAKEIHTRLLKERLICPTITVKNIEEEILAFHDIT